jgi:hypothetical protein
LFGLPILLLRTLRSIVALFVALEALYMSQVFLALVQGTRILLFDPSEVLLSFLLILTIPMRARFQLSSSLVELAFQSALLLDEIIPKLLKSGKLLPSTNTPNKCPKIKRTH